MIDNSLLQKILPLSYFHTITILESSFLEKNFIDLAEEPLFTAPPFSNFKDVCTIGLKRGLIATIDSPINGMKQFTIHPLLRKQCLKRLKHPENKSQQIDHFFTFIEYQYRIIYLLSEWVNHPDWQQVLLAQHVLTVEEENIRSYFEATLKDNQSFLGALGLLNIYYQISNKSTLRKKVLNQVLLQYETTSKEAYDIEIYEEYKQALLFVGDVFFDDQQYEDALKQYQTALKLFGQLKSTDEEWALFLSCQRRIASAHYALRNFDRAEGILLSLAPQISSLNNASLIVSTTQAIATFYAERNRDFEKAIEWLNKGIAQLQQKENLSHKIALHQELGNLYLQFDAYESAKQEWFTILGHYMEMGDEKAQADIHNNLGALYFTLGDNKAAKKHYKQSLAYYLPLEDEFLKAELLSNLGATFTTIEEIPEHQSYFQQALAIYQRQESSMKIAQVYQGLGSMEESLDNYQASEVFYKKALNLFREYEEADSVGELLHNLGHLHFSNKAYAKSEKLLTQALAIYEKRQDKSGVAEVYQNLGNLAYEKEDDDTAKAYFEKALDTFRELEDSFLEAGVRWNLGVLFKNQAAYLSALEHFSIALKIFQSFQVEKEIMETAKEIAETHIVLNRSEEALSYLKIALAASLVLEDHKSTTSIKQQIEIIQSI